MASTLDALDELDFRVPLVIRGKFFEVLREVDLLGYRTTFFPLW